MLLFCVKWTFYSIEQTFLKSSIILFTGKKINQDWFLEENMNGDPNSWDIVVIPPRTSTGNSPTPSPNENTNLGEMYVVKYSPFFSIFKWRDGYWIYVVKYSHCFIFKWRILDLCSEIFALFENMEFLDIFFNFHFKQLHGGMQLLVNKTSQLISKILRSTFHATYCL